MALFRNFGVNRRHRLCGVQMYAFAQSFDFIELAENGVFWIGNLSVPFIKPLMGTGYTATCILILSHSLVFTERAVRMSLKSLRNAARN
jgi:hypothetical protein